MKNKQVRLRLPEDVEMHLRPLPNPLKNQLIAIMLRAQISKVDLKELAAMRKELSSLGTLINQSLRTSWGMETDKEAVSEVVIRLQALLAL